MFVILFIILVIFWVCFFFQRKVYEIFSSTLHLGLPRLCRIHIFYIFANSESNALQNLSL